MGEAMVKLLLLAAVILGVYVLTKRDNKNSSELNARGLLDRVNRLYFYRANVYMSSIEEGATVKQANLMVASGMKERGLEDKGIEELEEIFIKLTLDEVLQSIGTAVRAGWAIGAPVKHG